MRGQTARMLRKLSKLPNFDDYNSMKRKWNGMDKNERTKFREEAIEVLNLADKNTKSL